MQGILSRSNQRLSSPTTVSNKLHTFRTEAEQIFSNYALSPADFTKAVHRFIRMSGDYDNMPEDLRPPTSDTVYRVLYSLECENVWQRNSN